MESKTIGGNKVVFHNSLRGLLKKHPALLKYEVGLILKAFKKTMWYFINNAIEFEFKNFFKFVKVHKKERQLYIVYRKEFQTIPEHDMMKFKPYESFKDYMNCREKFKDAPHREKLEGEERNPDIF